GVGRHGAADRFTRPADHDLAATVGRGREARPDDSALQRERGIVTSPAVAVRLRSPIRRRRRDADVAAPVPWRAARRRPTPPRGPGATTGPTSAGTATGCSPRAWERSNRLRPSARRGRSPGPRRGGTTRP